MATTPVSVLKPALRVIHCLQKERGTSCATSAALIGSSNSKAEVEDECKVGKKHTESKLAQPSLTGAPGLQTTTYGIEVGSPRENSFVVSMLHNQLSRTRLDTDLALSKLRGFLDGEAERSATYSSSTKKALQRLRGSEKSIEKALFKVRSLIPFEKRDSNLDNCFSPLVSGVAKETSSSPDHPASFHRVYVAYNALIGYVINDVIKHQMNEFEILQVELESRRGMEPTISSPIRKIESSCDMSELAKVASDESQEGPQERCTGGSLLTPKRMGSGRPKGHRRGVSLGIPKLQSEIQEVAPQRSRTRSTTDFRLQKTNSDFGQRSVSLFSVRKAAALYKLLYSFVQLKESTGTERAYLFAMLAMPTPKDTITGCSSYGSLTSDLSSGSCEGCEVKHSNKKREVLSERHALLFNNLVLEVENSRSILKDVQHQARKVMQLEKGQSSNQHDSEDEEFRPRKRSQKNFTGAWLIDLVQEVLQPSKAFVQVQNLIRRDFDLLSFRKAVTMEEFWGLLTVYIEKLHSLELLIIEELESSYDHTILDSKLLMRRLSGGGMDAMDVVPEPDPVPIIDVESKNKVTPDVRDLLRKVTALTENGDAEQRFEKGVLIQQLASLSADDLKAAIISTIGHHEPSQQKRTSLTLAKDISEVDKALQSIDIFEDPVVKPANNLQNEWEIGLYEVKFLRRIGKGAAGTTYFGKWRGEPVALKVASTSALGVEGWSAEIETLTHLHHPNVIRMLGCINNESPLTRCLVLEFCDAGDLESVLLKPAPHNLFFRAAHGLANGMAYLHNRKIIHRDIKPSNVLLHGDYNNGNFVVKLTDFGVATKMKEESRSNYTAETGTYRWMAPEVIRHEEYSNKADIYSFALLLWQLLTREEPFAPQSQLAAAGMVAIEHARPPLPDDTPTGIKELIQSCWSDNQDERPGSEDVTSLLLKVDKALTEDEKMWLGMPMGHQVYLFTECDHLSDEKGRKSAAGNRLSPARVAKSRSSLSDQSASESSDNILSPHRRRLSSKMGFGHGSKKAHDRHQRKKFSFFKKKAPNDSVKLFLRDGR